MNRIKENLGSVVVCLIEMVAGILLLINPIGLTTSVIVLAGILLAAEGICGIIGYFRTDAVMAAANRSLVKGLLDVSAGLFCIMRSKWFLAAFPVLTILYGIITLIVGLYKVEFTVDQLRLKGMGWGWSAFSAALTLLVAAVILMNPFSSTAVLWTFIAVAMIVEAILDIVGIVLACKRA